jgi:exonuclease SbcC
MSKPLGGFVINEIELKGFMRYRDSATIPFRDKFTVITGPTGSGKTSLLDAVTFALYGNSSRTDEKVKVEDFVDKNGYVKLLFNRDAQQYVVTRGRKNGRNYLALARESQRIAGSTTDLDYKIQNLVGLDYVGFRNSTFIRQDEMKSIGSESGAERLKIFERLFRLEIFQQAQELADKKLRIVENKLVAAKTDLAGRQRDFRDTLPKEKERLEEAERNYFNLSKEIKELEKKSGTVQDLVDRLEPIHKKYETATREIKNTGAKIQQEKNALDAAVKKNVEREKLQTVIKKLRNLPEEEKRLNREREGLEKNQQKYNSLLERKEDSSERITQVKIRAAAEITKLVKDAEAQHKRLTGLARALGKEEAFNLLRHEGALTALVERITKEMGWFKDLLPASFTETLAMEQKGFRTDLVKTSRKTRKITGDVFRKSEIEENIRHAEERLKSYKEQAGEDLASEQAKMNNVDGLIKKAGFAPADITRLIHLKKRLKEITNSVRQHDTAMKKIESIPDQGALITSLRANLEHLSKKLQSHTETEKRLEGEEERYSKALEEKEASNVTISNAREQLGKARGEKGLLAGRVKELEALGPIIRELEEGLSDLGRDEEVLTVLKQNVFHRSGIIVFAIGQVLQGISIEASNILGELTDERLNKIRLTPTSEPRGGAVKIEVEGVDGLFHDVSVLSGGEKTQVNAALRFAISKELARMPQVGKSYGNMKTLFIDEGDLGSLDTESARVFFVRKLLSMGDTFERVILVTHIAEIAEQFRSRIRVSMTPERYSRVEVEGMPA